MPGRSCRTTRDWNRTHSEPIKRYSKLEQLLGVAQELESDERAAIVAFLERIDEVLRQSEQRPSSAPGRRGPRRRG